MQIRAAVAVYSASLSSVSAAIISLSLALRVAGVYSRDTLKLSVASTGVAVFLFLASSSIFDRQSERTCPAQLLASTSPSAAAVQRLFRELVEVPEAEVGQVAICASVRTEGRFITEWLLYVSCPLCPWLSEYAMC